VGVDDWAWRKGQWYGTILVDLETHAPIDLLPDRSADSLATWLQLHPGEEVISRDRAGLYADGATRGAPQAIQVADRFHLLCNLTSAVERVLEQKRGALATAIPPPIAEPSPPLADSTPVAKSRSEQVSEERRQHRVDRYSEVVAMAGKGMSQQEISRTLHLGRKTIRRFLRAGQFPERAKPHRRPSSVNAFQEYLTRRWAEGCHNATKLWHEFKPRVMLADEAPWRVLFSRSEQRELSISARRSPRVGRKQNLHLHGRPPCCYPVGQKTCNLMSRNYWSD
jgi:transposase